MVPTRAHTRRQAGVAALEFALTVTIMLMLVIGIVGFGALFWSQQKLSKAAGEGVQAALYASLASGSLASGQTPTSDQLQQLQAKLQTVACNAVQREASILIASGSSDALAAQNCALQVVPCPSLSGSWLPATGDAPAYCASVNLKYSLINWPLVSLMASLANSPIFSGANWFPTQISAQAVVQVTPSTTQSASSS